MDREYRDKMERVRLSASGKQSMMAELSAEGQKCAFKPRRVLRAGLLAAVIAVMLTITAGAVLLVAPVLRDYYGGAGYDQSSSALGELFVRNGWSMTLTDCAGDDNYLYLGLDLAAPEGIKLDEGPYNFLQFGYSFKDRDHPSMACRLEQVPAIGQSDNHLRFILWIETQSDGGTLNGHQLDLQLGGLYSAHSWNEEEQGYDTLLGTEAPWFFGPLTIDYPDSTIRLAPNTPVTVLGVTATLTTVEVSPIGVTLQIQGANLNGHHKKYNNGYCTALPEITLYGKDGDALIPDKNAAPFGVRGGSGCSGGSDKTEEGSLRIVQSYGYLLDLDALDRIEVCGVSIPLQ